MHLRSFAGKHTHVECIAQSDVENLGKLVLGCGWFCGFCTFSDMVFGGDRQKRRGVKLGAKDRVLDHHMVPGSCG